MEIRYEKLVRDRIPQIIEAEGYTPNIRILSDDEYSDALRNKLTEEVKEYLSDRNVEELADILEVIYALAWAHGLLPESLEQIRKTKEEERGGFEKRLWLISKTK